ncbi:MAG: cytochrome b/b6 domain-containing protein [Sideroxyarcus sp.]|nr:cytochrome b/b6 domain-containing protein [Sideroxyarcus sp.]
MNPKNIAAVALAIIVSCAALAGPARAQTESANLDNASCLTCHDGKKGKLEVAGKDGEKRTLAALNTIKFAKGTHGDMQCVACHTEITDSVAKHKIDATAVKPDCVSCHEALWEIAKKENLTEEKARLGLVVQNIDAYKNSFHARPDTDEPSRAKASCENCHSSHEFNVPPAGSTRRTVWHKEIPRTCGEKCHEDQFEDYTASIHGEAVLEQGNIKAAVCTDCHNSHNIAGTSSDAFKLANVEACGTCHEQEYKSYNDTYHGQVVGLGYTYTARCSDCHGSHDIRAVDDPNAKVSTKNRLKTCSKCHSDKKPGMRDATPGFMTFGPHANTHDIEKYPQMYFASKFMIGLLIFVFAFFWGHSALWYYREAKERREGRPAPYINLRGLQLDEHKHFKRFKWGWRLAHLVFAIVTMTLILTGMTALYASSSWAPFVAQALGGPRIVGMIHRVCAALFVTIFLIHFVWVMVGIFRSKTFRWFGPDSFIPNWKDFRDCWAMFKWFFGKGIKPRFDRWTYFEKFDYWAVFWGVNIIGWSGLMLAFPHVTATYLPGWVFNVGILVHGEEGFLAAVFLFTVHFFNNHFRPDKLPPPDVVMFTGTQSLEEFRKDHPAYYQRLVDSGELEQYLVDAPAPQMTRASKILGLTLIAIGLTLLAVIAIGFFGR